MAQVYQVLPQYGYEMKRVNPTLVLQLPTDTVNNKLGIARVGSTLYVGNGTYWTGGSGNYLDSFWRVPGIDSNYYRINGVTYAVLDSTGGGGGNIYNSDGTLTADRTIDANGKLFEIQSATKNQFILDPVNQYWAMGDWAGDFGNATSIHIADSIGEVRIDGDLNVQGEKTYDFTHDNYPIYWDQQTQDYKSGWSIDSLWRASADSLKFRVAGNNTKAGIFSIYAPTSTGNYLDSFWRVSGIDSNYYRINGVTYAVLDSTGGGGGTYTADAPIIITGTVISADTSKAAGNLATYSDVQAKVSKQDFVIYSYASTITWDNQNAQLPLAKTTATGSFTLLMTNVKPGATGLFKIVTNTASAITVAFDTTHFTNKIFNTPLSTYTFAAGTGKDYFLQYIADSTKLQWSVIDTLIAGGGSSQWTTSGSDIYYNTGSAIVGATSALKKLTVNGTVNGDGLAINSTTTGWPATAYYIDGISKGVIGVARGTGDGVQSASANSLFIRSHNKPIIFSADSGQTIQAVLLSNGNFGVGGGTTMPANLFTVGTSSTSFTSTVKIGKDQDAETSVMVSNSTNGTSASSLFRVFGANNKSTVIGEISDARTGTLAEYAGSFIFDINNGSGSPRHIIISNVSTGNSYWYMGGRAASNRKMALYGNGNLVLNPAGSTADNGSTIQINGSMSLGYVAKTATYTATASDYTINCTANTFTVTLPTAVGITGRVYVITNSGAGTITVGTTSSQTFVNVTATPTTITMATLGAIMVQSNGANWLQIK